MRFVILSIFISLIICAPAKGSEQRGISIGLKKEAMRAENRVALVIGNSKYASSAPLNRSLKNYFTPSGSLPG
jgi:hypothetical protein